MLWVVGLGGPLERKAACLRGAPWVWFRVQRADMGLGQNEARDTGFFRAFQGNPLGYLFLTVTAMRGFFQGC